MTRSEDTRERGLGRDHFVPWCLFKKSEQVLARPWRKGNPPTVLVGVQAGAASVDIGVEIPQGIKNGSAF